MIAMIEMALTKLLNPNEGQLPNEFLANIREYVKHKLEHKQEEADSAYIDSIPSSPVRPQPSLSHKHSLSNSPLSITTSSRANRTESPSSPVRTISDRESFNGLANHTFGLQNETYSGKHSAVSTPVNPFYGSSIDYGINSSSVSINNLKDGESSVPESSRPLRPSLVISENEPPVPTSTVDAAPFIDHTLQRKISLQQVVKEVHIERNSPVLTTPTDKASHHKFSSESPITSAAPNITIVDRPSTFPTTTISPAIETPAHIPASLSKIPAPPTRIRPALLRENKPPALSALLSKKNAIIKSDKTVRQYFNDKKAEFKKNLREFVDGLMNPVVKIPWGGFL